MATTQKATLAHDLRTLGFSATANALQRERTDEAAALEHIRVRVATFDAAAARFYKPGTVGEADHRRFTAWLGVARETLARHGIAA